MGARGFHIVRGQPVGGRYLIEPWQLRFIRVAVIAGVPENLANFGRGLDLGNHGRIAQRGSNELDAEKRDQSDGEEAYKSSHGCLIDCLLCEKVSELILAFSYAMQVFMKAQDAREVLRVLD